MLYAICSMLSVRRYMMYVMCYMLYVICYTIHVICCMIDVIDCTLLIQKLLQKKRSTIVFLTPENGPFSVPNRSVFGPERGVQKRKAKGPKKCFPLQPEAIFRNPPASRPGQSRALPSLRLPPYSILSQKRPSPEKALPVIR